VHKWRARAAKRQDTAVTAPNVSFVPVHLRRPALPPRLRNYALNCAAVQ
jgi:hypothetical protein